MANPTADDFRAAARKAYQAGDVATARKLIKRAKAAESPRRSPQETWAAAKRGQLQASPDSIKRAQLADDVATAKMGIPSTPRGEARAVVDDRPNVGARAVRSQGFPVLGEWADEIAGAGEFLLGGNYDQGRNRFNETAKASMGAAPLTGGLQKTGGALYNAGRGFVQGGVSGGVDAAASAAGRAEPGERLEAARDNFMNGALVGASFSGALNLGLGALGKGVKRAISKSAVRPTRESLQEAKDVAYRAVDDSGYRFSVSQYDEMVDGIEGQMANPRSSYVKGDWKTEQALRMLRENRGDLTLSELDDLRKRIWKRWKSAAEDEQDMLLRMVQSIDGLIESADGADATIRAARAAHSRLKKFELLEDAFTKATDKTSSTGSGGNIFNKFKQAVENVINTPSKSRFFSQAEIDRMRNFVRGDLGEEAMRRIGKLSPNGNGLMQALNIGAIAADPAFAGVTAAATGAKYAADRKVQRGAEQIMDFIGTGQIPVEPGVRVPSQVGVAGGLAAEGMRGLLSD